MGLVTYILTAGLVLGSVNKYVYSELFIAKLKGTSHLQVLEFISTIFKATSLVLFVSNLVSLYPKYYLVILTRLEKCHCPLAF